jgi:1-acyl-sn-glycerol-3-phosphate acyltransferase/nucleoside-diphosphate-sugar epimerase
LASVAVVAASERLADHIVKALRESAGVTVCERAPAAGRLTINDADWLQRFDTVVYAPPAYDRSASAPDLTAASAMFDALTRTRLAHLVVISSAAIYSADHHNVGLMDESAFITDRGREIVRRWMAFEHEAAHTAPAETVVTVLRPAAVLDGANYFSRLFGGGIAVVYPGHDPTIQLLSPIDLAGAVRAVVEQRPRGVFNVAPSGGVPLKRAIRLAGATRLSIPRTVQRLARAVLSPLGLAAQSEQVGYIQYLWTVSGDKLRREVGFAPSRSSAQAILELRGKPTAGAPQFDEFGMDPDYIRRYCRQLFHFLHEHYWRVEVEGLERVPRQGRGVLVGMHRGFMPFDGTMALYDLVRRVDRIPRFLIHPSLTKFPFLADFMGKLGGIMACQENGDYVLQRDELLGVFPEGIRGAFTMYKRAYTLGKFGRDEYVRMALRNRAPILPFVTVGSAEIYPILGRVDWSWFKRYTEWPFLPVTNPFPLPTKWHTRFLPPMHIENEYPPEAAEDPALVRKISIEVRQRMQATIDDMLLRRRRIFSGSIFNGIEKAS